MANKKNASSKMIDEDKMPETGVSKDFINFFIDGLKTAYGAQKQSVKIFAQMQKTAAAELKQVFADQSTIAHLQLERLELVFELLSEPRRPKKSEAMEDLAEAAHEMIKATEKGSQGRDMAIILAAQKIAIYESETYRAFLQLAEKAGDEDIISLLKEILSEKDEWYNLLTALAEKGIYSAPSKENPEMEQNATAVYDSVNLTGKKIIK